MSSPRDASPCEAVIVHVDPASPGALGASDISSPQDGSGENFPRQEACGDAGLRHGTLRRGGRWPGGPLRLPLRHQAEFVQQFNQLYRALGLRLEIFDTETEVKEQDPPAETP